MRCTLLVGIVGVDMVATCRTKCFLALARAFNYSSNCYQEKFGSTDGYDSAIL